MVDQVPTMSGPSVEHVFNLKIYDMLLGGYLICVDQGEGPIPLVCAKDKVELKQKVSQILDQQVVDRAKDESEKPPVNDQKPNDSNTTSNPTQRKLK